METLVDNLSNYFNCRPIELYIFLFHLIYKLKAKQYFKGKSIYTTYGKRVKYITFKKFSQKSAKNKLVYEGYLNITYQVHFYEKYPIKLIYPHLKLLVNFLISTVKFVINING